jgi:hypothetical protein
MAVSTEIEMQRYSEELVAHTLRQFYAARAASQDQRRLAAADDEPPRAAIGSASKRDPSRISRTGQALPSASCSSKHRLTVVLDK